MPTALALLAARAAIHLADWEGRTPLHAAVECAMLDLVARLIQEKAVVNRTTKAGRTPVDLSIYWAIRNPIHIRDSTAVIRLLLSAGGLAAQEMWPEAETPRPHQLGDQDLDNERIWTAQCRRAGRLLKEWHVPPPGSTSEVRLDDPNPRAAEPTPADTANDCVTRQAKPATTKSSNEPMAVTGAKDRFPTTDHGDPADEGRGSDQEDEFTETINQLTAKWDQNEVISIHLPLPLEETAARQWKPNFTKHLFLELNLHHNPTP